MWHNKDYFNMKRLSWFRFIPQNWLVGKIQRCSREARADFIDLCCRYWVKEGKYLYEDASLDIDFLDELIKYKVVEVRGTHIHISFLDGNLEEVDKIRKSASERSNKRWSNAGSNASRNAGSINSAIQKRKEKKRIDKNIPTIEDFKKYALSRESTLNVKAIENKYEAWKENDWKDGFDNPIKNWKAKLLNTIPHLPKDKKQTYGAR